MNPQEDFTSERDISKRQFNAETTISERDVCEDQVGKQKAQDKCPLKPQYSYIALVAMAILDSPKMRRNLGDIIEYIKAKFPFYRQDCPVKRWQNSIRHNLSLNDCFIKTRRDPKQPSRGHLWTLHPRSLDMFEGGSFMRRNKRFNCPGDTQLKEGSKSPAEKLNSKAFVQGMKHLKRQGAQQLNSSNGLKTREAILTTQNQPHCGVFYPAVPQELRQSEMSDYLEPVTSGPMFETTSARTPGYIPFSSTSSRHPQYLFCSPLQQNLVRNEMAHRRYECPQCAGCTCDY